MSTKCTTSASHDFAAGVPAEFGQTTFQVIPKEYVRAMRRLHAEKLEQERRERMAKSSFWKGILAIGFCNVFVLLLATLS